MSAIASLLTSRRIELAYSQIRKLFDIMGEFSSFFTQNRVGDFRISEVFDSKKAPNSTAAHNLLALRPADLSVQWLMICIDKIASRDHR
jgi:hypothetical protein